MKFAGKWMQLVLLSEVTQGQKDRVCMVSLIVSILVLNFEFCI